MTRYVPANKQLFELPWDEEYAAAPGKPQPPQIVPRNEGEVRAVGKALKSTGLAIAGPATAAAAAGVVLSELRRLGYDVVDQAAWKRILLYVVDDSHILCYLDDCPTEGHIGLPGRRISLRELVDAVLEHERTRHTGAPA